MKTIHKFRRIRKGQKVLGQKLACTGKKCTLSEHVTYFWPKVKCKACKATKKKAKR